MILVIAEQRGGKLNRATWETVAGAQQLAGVTGTPITILVPGTSAGAVAGDLASAQVKEVVRAVRAAADKKASG